MSLRHTYTLFAPIYDLALEKVSARLRQQNLQRLLPREGSVLIAGIGTGLDIPHLPHGPHYVGFDLTPAMLKRARQRVGRREDITLHLADAHHLPYADNSFDAVVLHLILAVVPQPPQLLAEVARVVKPCGQILLLDKFLRPGQWAPVRRTLNVLSRRIATRTDVVFEEVLACCPQLAVERDEPALAGGWFRQIELSKRC